MDIVGEKDLTSFSSFLSLSSSGPRKDPSVSSHHSSSTRLFLENVNQVGSYFLPKSFRKPSPSTDTTYVIGAVAFWEQSQTRKVASDVIIDEHTPFEQTGEVVVVDALLGDHTEVGGQQRQSNGQQVWFSAQTAAEHPTGYQAQQVDLRDKSENANFTYPSHNQGGRALRSGLSIPASFSFAPPLFACGTRFSFFVRASVSAQPLRLDMLPLRSSTRPGDLSLNLSVFRAKTRWAEVALLSTCRYKPILSCLKRLHNFKERILNKSNHRAVNQDGNEYDSGRLSGIKAGNSK
ncbi:hypothetical protein EYF80_025097 [Liparis tanakae]|uniref:Uncharacterized protein n=1 Tax=Liparis tanakae TaxID=230148 RepID=A0A4Z2HGN4_9TELE|nr:hypothetical protein EYF80_025097 [Liparis tanakae]